ncbi:MAG TPA: hypothetical protein VH475_05570 [Tepidisphaeraceae bacterium]|jgi:hypothetical protein
MNLLESTWLGERLARMGDAELFPLLNVGSSTEEFRTRVQPYIDANIFAPLRHRGGVVYHADMKAAPGVDRVGDLLDPAFIDQLSKLQIRSILMSNLLEHVTDRQAVCDAILRLVPDGGYLFVSGPRDYPYHADPIDTMFRPTIDQAHALFPGTRIVESATIDSGNWRQWKAAERGRTLGRTLARLLTPFYRPRKWWELARQSPYLCKHITAFALVMQKQVNNPLPRR